MSDDKSIKRWTAQRKAAVVMDILKGKTTTAEVARQYDLTDLRSRAGSMRPSAAWKTGSRPPKDIREQ